jgi:epsilon-lactone hydrolase
MSAQVTAKQRVIKLSGERNNTLQVFKRHCHAARFLGDAEKFEMTYCQDDASCCAIGIDADVDRNRCVHASQISIRYVHDASLSLRSRLLIFLLRLTNRKAVYAKEFASGRFDSKDVPVPPSSLEASLDVNARTVRGRKVHELSPKGAAARGILFFVHGGGFMHNMSKQHWGMAGEIVRRSGWRIVIPDYPLAPAHTVDDALPMLREAYAQVADGLGGHSFAAIGDSAGGCLLLLLAQSLAAEGATLPQKLILLSPWLDVSMSNPRIDAIAPRDVMLQRGGLDTAAKALAGPHALDSAAISPLFGRMQGLPPMSIFIGGDEIFLPDCETLADMADAEGVPVDWFEYPGMFHVWPAMTMLPEAKHAIGQIVDRLKNLEAAPGPAA